MRPWVDRVTFPSIALQYMGDIILNLLIVASTFALLTLGVLLFSSSESSHSSQRSQNPF